MQKILNYIDGQLVTPVAGRFLDNYEPATGQVYSLVPDSDRQDVENAVQAAARAFPKWSKTPATERSRILCRIADLIDANLEQFALAESTDNGKPLAVARSLDIPRSASNVRFFGTAILHFYSESHTTDDQALNYTLRGPRGVCGLIVPWNFPLHLLTWKVSPAIAMGNTVVAKPSELTPMTAYLFSQVCIEAGLPPGVLNIIHGTGTQAGHPIVVHPKTNTISFTGGTKTGIEITQNVAPMLKKLTLELGGKNPNIVFADADLEEALNGSIRAAFNNQGQICLCGSRLFVEKKIYDQFLNRFVEKTHQLNVGDPLEAENHLGTIVSKTQWEKVKHYVALAQEEGGNIVCGGGSPENLKTRCRNGYFFKPTVITGLSPFCKTNQEEIFGPVVSVMPFEDDDQAVEFANCTNYGLSASIWTQNISRAHRLAEQIASGTVWVNCWNIRDLRVPFGGMKQSGVGREGGLEALRFYSEPKNVCIKL